MKRIQGDLIKLALDGHFDVIIHGCNCFCKMGAGIAHQIKKTFPKAFQADKETRCGDRNKLGRYSQTLVNEDAHPIIVVNGYTQFHYEGGGVLADYNAIATLFAQLKKDFTGQRFGYPKIGAGLAGGDWEIISQIIDQALFDEDHTLVEFKKNA